MKKLFGRSKVSAETELPDAESPYHDDNKKTEQENKTFKEKAMEKAEQAKEKFNKYTGAIDLKFPEPNPKYDELWGDPKSFSEENFANHFIARRKWQQVFFNLLFWIVLIITCVLLYLVDPAAKTKPFQYKGQTISSENVLYIGIYSVGSALGMVLLIIILLFCFTGSFLWITLLLAFIALGVTLALTIIQGNLAAIITLSLIGFIFPMLFMCKLCGKIRFSTCVLKSAVLVATKYPSTIIFTVFIIIIQAALNYAFHVGTMAAYYHDVSPFVYIYVVISYFFLTNTIKNFSYTVIAGVASCWYFLNESEFMPKYPFWVSFAHMIGPSFGPCALGGLFQAICDTIDEINNTSKANPLFCLVKCCCMCLKCCVRVILMIINRFALIYCAMFGVNVKDAVKRWFKQKSKQMVNQCILATVIGASFDTLSWVSSSLCGAIASYFAAQKYGLKSPEFVFATVMGTFFGKQSVMLLSAPIMTMSDALFVGFGEAPQRLNTGAKEVFDLFGEKEQELFQKEIDQTLGEEKKWCCC